MNTEPGSLELSSTRKALLLEEFRAGTQLYIYEDHLRWSRFTTFSITEGTLLVAYFQPFVTQNWPIRLLVGFLGLLFSILMLSVMVRAQSHFDYRSNRMVEIENELRGDSSEVMTMYSNRLPWTNKDLAGWKFIGRLRATVWIPGFCILLIIA